MPTNLNALSGDNFFSSSSINSFKNVPKIRVSNKNWSQLPWGQPKSEIKLPPRKFTCPSFFVYFHVVISSYLKIYDT